jgi:hypothetical protein
MINAEWARMLPPGEGVCYNAYMGCKGPDWNPFP